MAVERSKGMVVRRHRRFLAAAVTAIIAVGCTGVHPNPSSTARSSGPPTTTAQSNPEEHPSPEPNPIVADRLARTPDSCANAHIEPHTVTPAYGAVLGEGPAYAGFYAEINSEHTGFRAPDAPRTEFGWRIKVLWVVRPKTDAMTSLSGDNAQTDEPLWFQIIETERAGTRGLLDPTAPGVPPSESGWTEFPSYLYFPRAGCYDLRADSGGAVWEVHFGFGK